MKDKDLPEKKNEDAGKDPLPGNHLQENQQEEEKTEVKNANAAGQGAIGRSGEKPGPEMNEGMNY